jgi:hypothetical protein
VCSSDLYTSPVSCHYLISKAGQVWQFVKDEDTAWHAGASRWRGIEVNGSLNAVSLGIELENKNDGRDPYPESQLAAAVALSHHLVTRYAIPREMLVRHLDISPGRKSDPRGFEFIPFLEAVYDADTPRYLDTDPILGTPRGTAAQAAEWLRQRTKHYAPRDIAHIVAAYQRLGESVGLDWFLALAQCAHETGSLTSALSARPVRNPAGIGITGESAATERPGYVWDSDRGLFRAACVFLAWTPEEAQGTVSSAEAHIGRLLAYALPPSHRFGPVQALVDKALSVRPLPLYGHGTAQTLRQLGRAHNPEGARGIGWASPGNAYGASIAALANRMRGL